MRRYDILLQEKEEIEELFEAFKSDVMTSRNGTAAKQIKILKQAVRNLDVRMSFNFTILLKYLNICTYIHVSIYIIQ